MRLRKHQRGFWNFVIPALATVGSAILGKKGQDDTNAANQDINERQMQFNAEQSDITRNWNAEEAAKQRQWSSWMSKVGMDYNTEMANTQYQRAVGDLRAAGLNPMLAYSQGGAPSPTMSQGGGAAATSSPASAGSQIRNENAVLAGINAAGAAAQLQNLTKQGDNIDADTALKHAQANRETASAGNLSAQTERIVTAEIPKIRKEILNVDQDTINKSEQQVLIRLQGDLSRMETMVKSGQVDQVEAQTALTKVERALKQLQIPEAQAYSEKFKSQWGGEVSPYLKEAVDILRTLIYSKGTR